MIRPILSGPYEAGISSSSRLQLVKSTSCMISSVAASRQTGCRLRRNGVSHDLDTPPATMTLEWEYHNQHVQPTTHSLRLQNGHFQLCSRCCWRRSSPAEQWSQLPESGKGAAVGERRCDRPPVYSRVRTPHAPRSSTGSKI